jgi:hypothetical protein
MTGPSHALGTMEKFSAVELGFCPGDSVAACGTDWFADAGDDTLASNRLDAGDVTDRVRDANAP